MENNKDDKRKKYLTFLLIVSVFMGILNYLLSDTVGFVGQSPVVAEQESEEVVEQESEEVVEQDDENMHRVYTDLGIDSKKHNLTISTDEKHFIYKCLYTTDTIDFVSKIDNSDFYSIIDIYKDSSYSYVVFKMQ